MVAAKDKKVTDLDLIKQFGKGSIEAFEELMERYEAKVYNMAMRFTRNQEDAEEVLQDVFSTLYRKLDRFEGKSAFSSWLYRIVVNAAFMKLRKRKQHTMIPIDELAPAVKSYCLDRDPLVDNRSDQISINRQVRDLLEGAINKLPDQYRMVFVLRDVDGMSNEEVGRVLDLTVPAVKSRLHRSRIMLRKKLRKFYDDYTGKKPAPGLVPVPEAA